MGWNQGLTHKLTLTCAPAGFRKTTLLWDWIVAIRGDNFVLNGFLWMSGTISGIKAGMKVRQ
jgi:ATP/maltotriose-dependent transcriptional regulator MalT